MVEGVEGLLRDETRPPGFAPLEARWSTRLLPDAEAARSRSNAQGRFAPWLKRSHLR